MLQHPSAAAIEAQILELVEGYHRILQLHKDEERVRPWRAGRHLSTTSSARRHHPSAGEHRATGTSQQTRSASQVRSSTTRCHNDPSYDVVGVRRRQSKEKSCATLSPYQHGGGRSGTTAPLDWQLEETHPQLRKRMERNSSAANSANRKRSGGSFIRAQLHTCRGAGRATSLSCAACAGMASVQHARFLEREALHQHNLLQASRAGLIELVFVDAQGGGKRSGGGSRRH